jgi:hypothetical protein
MLRDQFFVLQLEPKRAIEVLPSFVPEADAREKLLEGVDAIVGAGGPVGTGERDRLAKLALLLGVSAEKPVHPAKARRPSAAAAQLQV